MNQSPRDQHGVVMLIHDLGILDSEAEGSKQFGGHPVLQSETLPQNANKRNEI